MAECDVDFSSYVRPQRPAMLFDTTQERNQLFGYEYLRDYRVKENNDNAYMQPDYTGSSLDPSAPMDYYFDHIPRNGAATIGPMGVYPNIYDDQLVPTRPNFAPPRLQKNWRPLHNSAVPVAKGTRTTFVPHETQCEVNPIRRDGYWTADLNARIYEHRIVSGAKEQPYASWYRRQGLMSLVSKNVPPRNDSYTKHLPVTQQTYCQKLKTQGVPAVTAF